MADYYMTIHQFASLRGVSLGSLHYYEKLGLLKPAYTDPDTHYRYYVPEQLAVLDAIQLCVSLHIPLKELKNYQKGDQFDFQGFMQRGTDELNASIEHMKTRRAVMETVMAEMKENQKVLDYTGVYERELKERWYDTVAIHLENRNPREAMHQVTEIFAHHQKEYSESLYPGGIYVTYNEGELHADAMIRMMMPVRSRKKYVCLPAGRYICMHMKMEKDFCLQKVLEEYFPWHTDEPVMIANIILEKMNRTEKISEIQIYKGTER